jgi:hypothetical protein
VAYGVFLERGILGQRVPISLKHWLNPERSSRPGFLRNVARDGMSFDALSTTIFEQDTNARLSADAPLGADNPTSEQLLHSLQQHRLEAQRQGDVP